MNGLTRTQQKLFRGLSRRKIRDAEGLFVAEGVRVVEELLDAGLRVRLAAVSPVLEESERGRALLERLTSGDGASREGPGAASEEGAGGASEEGAGAVAGEGAQSPAGEVAWLKHGELLELTDTRTSQGVVVAAETPTASLEDAARGTAPTLVLDAVQDPGNLGTLARSAAAFGCGSLVALPGTVDAWNPRAVRASAGALFRLKVVSAEVDAVRSWLDAGGFTALGADAGGESVEAVESPERPALVVGNEGAGLGPEARSLCSRFVAVPMRGGTESLNVAVATGILLYLVTRGSV